MEQAGQRIRNLPLGPRSQMGYRFTWAPGYRGRLTVFTFIFDLWILVMFDPTKKLTESKIQNSGSLYFFEGSYSTSPPILMIIRQKP